MWICVCVYVSGRTFWMLVPDIVMPACVRCICWVLAAGRYWPGLLDTAPRSGGSLLALPVGGKPSRVGCPLQWKKKGKEKKSEASSKYHGPKSIYKTDIPLFICHRSETQKHTWTTETHTVFLDVWSANMCNEIGEYESTWIWNGVGLSSKLFIGDRWGVTDTEIRFQEHQQLLHLPLGSVTNGHI